MLSDILLIIPAYNEEANIERVVETLIKDYPEYDYVVVNDGSKDNTARICKNRGFHLVDIRLTSVLPEPFRAE